MAALTATQFDAIYETRFGAGHVGWYGDETEQEMLGHLDELLSYVDVRGRRAVDLGCGTGTLTLPLADRGFDVLGLDISAIAVARARQRAPAAGPDGSVHFEVHDVTRPLPLSPSSVDLMVDGLVLHYLTTPRTRELAVDNARDVLRADGALLVMTMCGEPGWLPPGASFDPATRCTSTAGVAECYYAPVDELLRLFDAAGLQPQYMRVVNGNGCRGEPDLLLASLTRRG